MNWKTLGRSVSAAAVILLTVAGGWAQVPASKHVILIIDENSSFTDVTADMPWLVSQGNTYGYATNYESDNGGSLLDYLWLASGSCESAANCTLPPGTHDFNCNGNNCYYPGTDTTDPITDDNIFRELNNAGISWKVYAQSYAAAGGTPTTPDGNNGTPYYRRHNGAVWYSDILSNVDGSSNNVVDFTELAIDLENNALPRYMIIVPDGNNDAHDCPVGMSTCTEQQKLAAADSFLDSTLTPILATPDFQPGGSGLIFVTFDECGAGTDGGCGASVYTAVIGPTVAPHTVSTTAYKHENTLRTMLDALNITTYPGASATAADMTDFFTTTGNNPEVVVGFPAAGSLVSSPVLLRASAFPRKGHTISGWFVYVDSVAVYNGGAASSIEPMLTMSNGTHTVVVRAWDTSGAYGSQTFSLTVTASKPNVSVAAPLNLATLGTPTNIVASATPTSGHSISGWWIYVDNNAAFNAGAENTINASVGMSAGTHTVMVRAWDTSGAYGDQTLTLTVSTVPVVTVLAPIAGQNVGSPMNVQASAVSGSGKTITGWKVYMDGLAEYSTGTASSINASVAASSGTHTVIVRAWDSSGAYGDQTFSVQIN